MEITSRRLAATRRRLQLQRDAVALLPDQVAQVPTLEQEIVALQSGLADSSQEWRDHWAANWRKARRSLSALPEQTRRGVLAYWDRWSGPQSPEYLLGFAELAVKGKSYWTQLRLLAQFRLIGERRLPASIAKAVFEQSSSGSKDLRFFGRNAAFYRRRRIAKRERRLGVKAPTGYAVQMGLTAAA